MHRRAFSSHLLGVVQEHHSNLDGRVVCRLGGVLIYIFGLILQPARMDIGIGMKKLAEQHSLNQNGTLTLIRSVGIMDVRFAPS